MCNSFKITCIKTWWNHFLWVLFLLVWRDAKIIFGKNCMQIQASLFSYCSTVGIDSHFDGHIREIECACPAMGALQEGGRKSSREQQMPHPEARWQWRKSTHSSSRASKGHRSGVWFVFLYKSSHWKSSCQEIAFFFSQITLTEHVLYLIMPAASESQVSFMQRRDWIKYELWKSLRKTQLHMEKKKQKSQ